MRKKYADRVSQDKDMSTETEKEQTPAKPKSGDTYPVLPLRDIVVFPHMIVPLFVGRDKSVKALEAVMQED